MNDAPQQSSNAPPAISGRAVVGIVAGALVMALGLVFAWQRWEIYGFSRLPAFLVTLAGTVLVSGAGHKWLRLDTRARQFWFGLLMFQCFRMVVTVNIATDDTLRVSLLLAALTALYVFAPVLKALIAPGRR